MQENENSCFDKKRQILVDLKLLLFSEDYSFYIKLKVPFFFKHPEGFRYQFL